MDNLYRLKCLPTHTTQPSRSTFIATLLCVTLMMKIVTAVPTYRNRDEAKDQ